MTIVASDFTANIDVRDGRVSIHTNAAITPAQARAIAAAIILAADVHEKLLAANVAEKEEQARCRF